MSLMLSCTSALAKEDEPPPDNEAIFDMTAGLVVVVLAGWNRDPISGVLQPDLPINGVLINRLTTTLFFADQNFIQFSLPGTLPANHWVSMEMTGLFGGIDDPVFKTVTYFAVDMDHFQDAGVTVWDLDITDVDSILPAATYAMKIIW